MPTGSETPLTFSSTLDTSNPGDIRIILEGGKVNAPTNLRLDEERQSMSWTAPEGVDDQTSYELDYTSGARRQTQLVHPKTTQASIPNLPTGSYCVTLRATKNGNYSATPAPVTITRGLQSSVRLTPISTDGGPDAFGELAVYGNDLFCTSRIDNYVYRGRVNGNSTIQLSRVSTENGPQVFSGLALRGNTLYCTNSKVDSSLYVGTVSNNETIRFTPIPTAGDPKYFAGVAVTMRDATLYFINGATEENAVYTGGVDGTNTIRLVKTPISKPAGWFNALTAMGEDLYAVRRTADRKVYMGKIGTGTINFTEITTTDGPEGFRALAVYGDTFYCVSSADSDNKVYTGSRYRWVPAT
ncbi:hypothetical protein C9F11_43755 (plasmid) [Streptomyces sp. YIM 121038]|uniref:hypothetical protein n=1 Tax=Streptomyces sp. YIM 121038 TaxID=2136401 RepID=UPI0011107BD0|nr:hypothetical protein [Streptomyces sp. YIM 121038]QCX82329.1 hypothetical protein C9F11_43755 [Streptomyces sp. YIM 121038]